MALLAAGTGSPSLPVPAAGTGYKDIPYVLSPGSRDWIPQPSSPAAGTRYMTLSKICCTYDNINITDVADVSLFMSLFMVPVMWSS